MVVAVMRFMIWRVSFTFPWWSFYCSSVCLILTKGKDMSDIVSAHVLLHWTSFHTVYSQPEPDFQRREQLVRVVRERCRPPTPCSCRLFFFSTTFLCFQPGVSQVSGLLKVHHAESAVEKDASQWDAGHRQFTPQDATTPIHPQTPFICGGECYFISSIGMFPGYSGLID